jgi:hypothetical protein
MNEGRRARARRFKRVLETARGLNEVASMGSLSDEQRAAFTAALMEHGEALPMESTPKQVTDQGPCEISRERPGLTLIGSPGWIAKMRAGLARFGR